MFQEAYKKAYDSKVPSRDLLQILEERKTAKSQGAWALLKPIAAALTVLFICGGVATPILAGEFPFAYRIVEKYAPGLADYVLPEALSSSKAGIKMQVEAVHVEEKDAEVLVSFTDEPGYEYIHGKVDLYDSYGLTCFSGDSNVGGCSFLEYDAAEDKAYFKLDLSSWDTFDQGKFRFNVRMLLTNCVEETQVVDLTGLDRSPILKEVALNGAGGVSDSRIEKYLGKSEEELWRRGAQVMQGTYDSTNVDKLEITAMGYQDGILRIQNCRGSFKQADRHMAFRWVDAAGNEHFADYSVDWQEELAGERVSFNEQWFIISEEELAGMQLEATYFVTDGCVEGDWEVVFEIP